MFTPPPAFSDRYGTYAAVDNHELERSSYEQARRAIYTHGSPRVGSASLFKRCRFRSKYQQRLDRMADTVYLVLHTLTHDGEESYGAEELILQRTQEMLAQEDADHRAELSDSDDYTALAYATIFHISYDLLASGKYNLQSTLNPLSPAPQLKRYVVRCLDWSVSAGQITEKEKEEQLLQLDREIRWH